MAERNIKYVPEYLDDPGQVGNKVWRLVPDDGIKISKETSSSVDTYTFSANISEEDGNVIEAKNDGLYVPVLTSKVEELNKEVDDLKDKIQKLKDTEYRPTESITFRKSESEDGSLSISAEVNISTDNDNCIELKADGLFCRSMDLTPGSISDIERRLTALETELSSINQDIDNLKTTAVIDSSNKITPPIVIPDSEGGES